MSSSTSLSSTVTFLKVGRIAHAVVNNPPVNALSHSVRLGLMEAVEALESDASLEALVIRCEGRGFFSGADIKEFGRPMADPQLGEIIDRIELASKPVIAAIHGAALGGGLELALACHYRVATQSASVGLPEVNLGIIPGSGGTQRLPRLIGLEAALEVITQARRLSAKQAEAAGALDALIGDDLESSATEYAEKLLASGKGPRPTRNIAPPPFDQELIDAARKTAARKKRGIDAPQTAIDAICLAYNHDFDEALKQEYTLCYNLLQGSQSKALRHMFAAERQVARVPGLENLTPRNIERVAVIGIGVMGSGIALAFANAGMPVLAISESAEKSEQAKARFAKAYDSQIKRGQITEATAQQRLALIECTASHDGLSNVDLVIEAVTEDMAIKKAVFQALGQATKPGTILASNTSYLDINALAQASGRPEDVCGMHFFNPANIMRLLENVRGEKTAPDVLATIMAVGKRIGKLSIMSGVCEGFVVNRLLAKRSREGFFMLEEGARPAQIDAVLKDYGFPMGPYALSDLAGIDVQYAARQARIAGFTEREKAANFVDQLFEKGRYGQKTGAGWYLYGDDRKPQNDPVIETLLTEHAERRAITQRTISNEEVLERCLFAMVNEGAKIIEDGIVARPHEIDVAMVNGIGWPSYTGGPMWWADSIGLDVLRDKMLRYADLAGAEYWTPAPLIETLARAGKGFYSA